MKRIYSFAIFLLIFAVLGNYGFAQTKDELEERALLNAKRRSLVRPSDYKLSMNIGGSVGYETNPRLSSLRKGDIFEESRFTLNFKKPLAKNLKFSFNYFGDLINFNEITDLNSLLNDLRFQLEQKFFWCSLGAGYDFMNSYYPVNENGNFIFNKGFVYVDQNITKKLFHRFQFEGGLKSYLDNKALAETITTYQDDKREDKRLGFAYQVALKPNKRLFASLTSKYTLNDSNAIFLDFYDYESYLESLEVNYEIFKNLSAFSNFLYIRKNYDSRLATFKDYKQKDDLYAGTLGLIFKPTKNNALSLSYSYRDNQSNDGLAEYFDNVITCGWQYSF